jgi:hypothetical protein
MAVRKSACALLFVAAVMLCPASVPAMELQMFDSMAPQDQRDYLKHLVRVAESVLREQGQADAGEKVDTLFRKQGSAGEWQFWNEMMQTRRLLDWQAAQNFHFTPLVGEVEDTLLRVLSNNQITAIFKIHREFTRVLRERPYWPKRTLHAD